jgi:hypothetical protein
LQFTVVWQPRTRQSLHDRAIRSSAVHAQNFGGGQISNPRLEFKNKLVKCSERKRLWLANIKTRNHPLGGITEQRHNAQELRIKVSSIIYS